MNEDVATTVTIFIYLCWPLILSGLIAGVIAKAKNKSFLGWFVYGFFVPLISQIHVIFSKRNINMHNTKKCPYCSEIINEDAIICKHCGSKLDSIIE